MTTPMNPSPAFPGKELPPDAALPTISPTALPGVLLVKPRVRPDARGCFLEMYRQDTYAAVGICAPLVQDNFSHSIRNVLRGLHYQLVRPQSKLISVTRGAIFDVAVDIRQSSPTFGQWIGVELSDKNRHQLYIPEGFAHGFCVLSETADLHYKCSNVYHGPGERGIHFASARFAIDWPVREPILSDRDAALPDADHLCPGDWPEA